MAAQLASGARIPPVKVGAYLHIPFCQVRCSYCDFNTYAGLDGLVPSYVAALASEVRQMAQAAARAGHGRLTVATVFFGGGTPSLLPVTQVRSLLMALGESFEVEAGSEITLEANPGTVDDRQLSELRASGINRISFGVQSAQAAELQLLDRLHTFEQAVQAVRWARQAGFENINLDLIYGIMGQSLAGWQDTLRRALDMAPEHLSLYALTLEDGTPMQARVVGGELPAPDGDAAADMYEWAGEELGRSGYRHYEISNWALDQTPRAALQPSRACRHNLITWRLEPYLGFGAGAHGAVPGLRYANIRHPRAYIERMNSARTADFPRSPAALESWPIDGEAERRERLLLGLRLVEEGVGESGYEARFGSRLMDDFGPSLRGLREQGLVEWDADRVRLTKRAHLLANRVFVNFV